MRMTIMSCIIALTWGCTRDVDTASHKCAALGTHGPDGAFRHCVTYDDPSPGYSLHADTSVWHKVGDFVIEAERSLVHFIDHAENAEVVVLVGPDSFDAKQATDAHRKDVLNIGWPAGPVTMITSLPGRNGYEYRYEAHRNTGLSTHLAAHFRFDCASDVQFFIRANWLMDDTVAEAAVMRVVESVRPKCPCEDRSLRSGFFFYSFSYVYP